MDESIDQLLQNNPDYLTKFNVVIATAVNERTIISLSQKLWAFNIPLILCRSIGMIGTIRIQLKEHYVIEAHPDGQKYDLRLENPFPGLKEHMDKTVLTSKIPWLVVLYKFLEKWRIENQNKIPQTYKEKSEIRELIRSAMTADEENYEEAIKAVNFCFGGGKITTKIKQILDHPQCMNLNKNVSKE